MAEDDEFRRLLLEYEKPPGDLNPEMVGVELDFHRGDPRYGALHMAGHGLSETDVWEVIFELPEVKQRPGNVGRTEFWGTTRRDREIMVVCEDFRKEKKRYLVLITAYDHPEAEWNGKRKTAA